MSQTIQVQQEDYNTLSIGAVDSKEQKKVIEKDGKRRKKGKRAQKVG